MRRALINSQYFVWKAEIGYWGEGGCSEEEFQWWERAVVSLSLLNPFPTFLLLPVRVQPEKARPLGERM